MKLKDTVPVTIAGQEVAQAEIVEISDGQVTLIVPARRVVMATRTEIAFEQPPAPEPAEPEKEVLITGVDRATGEPEAPVVETPAPEAPAPVETPAPVVETPPVVEETPPAVEAPESHDE